MQSWGFGQRHLQIVIVSRRVNVPHQPTAFDKVRFVLFEVIQIPRTLLKQLAIEGQRRPAQRQPDPDSPFAALAALLPDEPAPNPKKRKPKKAKPAPAEPAKTETAADAVTPDASPPTDPNATNE